MENILDGILMLPIKIVLPFVLYKYPTINTTYCNFCDKWNLTFILFLQLIFVFSEYTELFKQNLLTSGGTIHLIKSVSFSLKLCH